MSAVPALVACVGLWLPASEPSPPPAADPARLREMLHERQRPQAQSQAALLLVQSASPDAEEVVRQGLRQNDAPDVFLALAAALRLCPSNRFADELLAALAGDHPAVRRATAETLAALADARVVRRLRDIAEDPRADLAARQAAVWALGRSGLKPAAAALVDQLAAEPEPLRTAAAEALADLSGLPYGADAARWRAWWERHKDVPEERWLGERLAYQTGRTRRLEGDLERARAQLVRVHQQLYGRLPAADRLSHVQALAEQDDPALRALAAGWGAELLAVADALGQRALTDVLLRLSRDASADVQRSAVLALSRVADARALDRLLVLLRRGPAPVRAAAARSLAQQARGTSPEALARQKQVVPALQKALEDPALEVVVEAAEDLGVLGAPEAGPVLTALLRHPSEPVRQTAALALERVADGTVLDALLELPDDAAATVRFGLVGALGRAAGDGRGLGEAQRAKLLARLEGLLLRDADPGVRSRAATVLGECGTPAHLATLWRRVLAAEDSRVQDKSWTALVEIVVRSASPDVLREWDRTLSEAGQASRRLQLLSEVCNRWQKREETRAQAGPVAETLVQAQLEQGKWTAAFPLVRDLLARPGGDAEAERYLRWLLQVGEQALRDGNRAEALRAAQEAQPHLPRGKGMAGEFERLEKQARQED
jgi:HEAT repeat protein